MNNEIDFNKIEYPYLRYYYKLDLDNYKQVIRNFKPNIFHYIPKELDKYKNKLEKYEQSFFIIKDIFEKTYVINSLTDYFTEKVRIKCKFGNYLSPKDYWLKYNDNIIKETLQKYKKINIILLRESLYNNSRFCNNFRISVGLTVINHFKPKKWLDISAGWGDRLITALMSNVELYVSCDPNLELHKYYNEIINTLAPKEKQQNYIILKNGFIESSFPNLKFDLVFSSPPFFTLEKYSEFKEDSITQFSDEQSWTQNFLIKSLIKSYNYLDKNGHLVLYIDGSPYVLNEIKRLNKVMQYKGIIYFFDNKPRAMYVWKKINDNIINSI